MREEILDMEQTNQRPRASVWKHGLAAGLVITVLLNGLQQLYPLAMVNYEGAFSTYELIHFLQKYLTPTIFFGGILFAMFRVSVSYLNHFTALRMVITTGVIAYQTTILLNSIIALFLVGNMAGLSWGSLPIILSMNVGIVVAAIPLTWLPSVIPYFRKRAVER